MEQRDGLPQIFWRPFRRRGQMQLQKLTIRRMGYCGGIEESFLAL